MRCAICQRDDRPLTREHVFARWLTQRVGSAGASRATATVCAECNAGWMSTLEVAFRQAVFARPRQGPIPATDRTTIARWSAKTAILLADAAGVSLVPPPERAPLLRGMPDALVVSIARRRRVRTPLGSAFAEGMVVIHVDELALSVTRNGAVADETGTRLWPLRTHQLRWDTLPVVS